MVDQVQVVRVEGLDGRRGLHSERVDADAQIVVDLHRILGQGDRQRILCVAGTVMRMMSFISTALITARSLQHIQGCAKNSCIFEFSLPLSAH